MDSCPYFHEEMRGSGANRQKIPCCRHKHTPVSCNSSSLRTAFPYLLRCDGRLSRCQIPPHEQLDID